MRRLELISVTGESIRLDEAPYFSSPSVTLSGMPAVSLSSHVALGSAGSRVSNRRHATRDVPLKVAIIANSATEFDQAVNRLARAIDPAVGDVAIRFHREDGTVREVVASYVDGFRNITLAWSGSAETETPLLFEAFDPYWRSSTEAEYDILANEFANGGSPTGFNDSTVRFNAIIPFNGFNATGFQYFQVDLVGDVVAWPRWDITGPGTQITAVNMTTGKIWSYTPALAADVRLVVDTRPAVKQVTRNDANVFAGLSDDSELWPLVPGRNWVGLRVQSWEANRSKMLLSWRERFLTC